MDKDLSKASPKRSTDLDWEEHTQVNMHWSNTKDFLSVPPQMVLNSQIHTGLGEVKQSW